MSTRIAVIGGGIAGLACACDLADAGIEVVLLESRKNLGGRAYSFRDQESGATLDNCQHVLLGCCDEAVGFFTRIGSIDRVDFRDSIRLVADNGSELVMKQSMLPPPLHMGPSLVASSYLSAGDKLGLARALKRVCAQTPMKGISARDYLKSISCPGRAMERLIEPILISALNERLDSASAESARMVLIKTLAESRGGYRMGVPKAPLAEMLEEPVSRYLESRGCQVRLSTKVDRVYVSGRTVSSLVLENGHRVRCGAYVFATPPWSLESMGMETWGGGGLEWRAIVGVHLFMDNVDSNFDCACLAGEPFGWVFNKTADFGLGFGCVQAVASAADDIVGLPKDDLVKLAMRAVEKAAPGAGKWGLTRATVYRARQATFSTGHLPQAVRPSAETPLANVFMAGDWTDTGWPATMEGAVRSGRAAAKAVLDRVG